MYIQQAAHWRYVLLEKVRTLAFSSTRSPFCKDFLWISVSHLLQAVRNGWKNTFNLWVLQKITLEALVFSGKLFYIFINSKGTFQSHSLFNKQIMYCQQTPLQQVLRELQGNKFTLSVLMSFPLLCIPQIQKLKYPCTHCMGKAIQKEFSETFFLPFSSLPSLKISQCCQKSALTQARICSATYFL